MSFYKLLISREPIGRYTDAHIRGIRDGLEPDYVIHDGMVIKTEISMNQSRLDLKLLTDKRIKEILEDKIKEGLDFILRGIASHYKFEMDSQNGKAKSM